MSCFTPTFGWVSFTVKPRNNSSGTSRPHSKVSPWSSMDTTKGRCVKHKGNNPPTKDKVPGIFWKLNMLICILFWSFWFWGGSLFSVQIFQMCQMLLFGGSSWRFLVGWDFGWCIIDKKNLTSSHPNITDSTGESSVILVGQLRVLERNKNTFLLRLESSCNSIFFKLFIFLCGQKENTQSHELPIGATSRWAF